MSWILAHGKNGIQDLAAPPPSARPQPVTHTHCRLARSSHAAPVRRPRPPPPAPPASRSAPLRSLPLGAPPAVHRPVLLLGAPRPAGAAATPGLVRGNHAPRPLRRRPRLRRPPRPHPPPCAQAGPRRGRAPGLLSGPTPPPRPAPPPPSAPTPLRCLVRTPPDPRPRRPREPPLEPRGRAAACKGKVISLLLVFLYRYPASACSRLVIW